MGALLVLAHACANGARGHKHPPPPQHTLTPPLFPIMGGFGGGKKGGWEGGGAAHGCTAGACTHVCKWGTRAPTAPPPQHTLNPPPSPYHGCVGRGWDLGEGGKWREEGQHPDALPVLAHACANRARGHQQPPPPTLTHPPPRVSPTWLCGEGSALGGEGGRGRRGSTQMLCWCLHTRVQRGHEDTNIPPPTHTHPPPPSLSWVCGEGLAFGGEKREEGQHLDAGACTRVCKRGTRAPTAPPPTHT